MKNVIENAIDYIKSFFADEYSGHDYYHSMRVYRTANYLAQREGADGALVSLAALLHDVDDIKVSPDTAEKKENAVAFLQKQGVAAPEIAKICQIIGEVSFQGKDSVTPSSIEGKCVQDADRLDALGAIGIARAFAYGGSHRRQMYDPDVPPVYNMSKEEYRKHVSTTVNHFYEKLFCLKELMNTDTAKELAREREAYMKAYLEEFLREWNGADGALR